jgi:hypothetical protein
MSRIKDKEAGFIAAIVFLFILIAMPILAGVVLLEIYLGVNAVLAVLDGAYWLAYGWSMAWLTVAAAVAFLKGLVGE